MDRDFKIQIMAWIIGIGVIIGGVIGIVALFQFQTIDINSHALKRNTLEGSVESKTYENGFYWSGFFGEFITFPKTVQTVAFNPYPEATTGVLKSITKDGLALTLDISYQYQLHGDELYELYTTYTRNYLDVFVKVSRDVLRDIASNFTAIEFLTDRLTIGNAMENALNIAFQSIYADIVSFQLTNIDLPNTFEAALESVKVSEQQRQVALFEQEAAIIRAETLLIDANATAELAVSLGLNSTELLQYLWIQAIDNHDGYLIIGTDVPIILNQDE